MIALPHMTTAFAEASYSLRSLLRNVSNSYSDSISASRILPKSSNVQPVTTIEQIAAVVSEYHDFLFSTTTATWPIWVVSPEDYTHLVESSRLIASARSIEVDPEWQWVELYQIQHRYKQAHEHPITLEYLRNAPDLLDSDFG